MKKYSKIVPDLFFIIFGITVLLIIPTVVKQSSDAVIGSRFFPIVTTTAIIALSTLSLFSNIIRIFKSEIQEPDKNKKMEIIKYIKIILILFLLICWIILIPYTGFLITTITFVILAMLLMGNRNVKYLVIIPMIFVPMIYYIFIKVLNVSFPEGTLFL